MQHIQRDCIEPQERHNAFNILKNQYFSKYEMCLNGQFSKN